MTRSDLMQEIHRLRAEIERLQVAEIDAGAALAQFNRNELALRAKLAEAKKALSLVQGYDDVVDDVARSTLAALED